MHASPLRPRAVAASGRDRLRGPGATREGAVDLDDPRLVTGAANVDVDRRATASRGSALLRPLDRGDPGAVQHLLEPQPPDLSQALGPIKVDVEERQAPRVLCHHDEGRARHGALDSEPGGKALDEAGLPRPEVAAQRHHRAGRRAPGDPAARAWVSSALGEER